MLYGRPVDLTSRVKREPASETPSPVSKQGDKSKQTKQSQSQSSPQPSITQRQIDAEEKGEQQRKLDELNDELMAYLISACQLNSEAMALLPASEGNPARFWKLLTDRYKGRDAIAKAARADKYANYVGPSSVRKVDGWLVHYKELVRQIEEDEGREEDLYKKSKKLLRLGC